MEILDFMKNLSIKHPVDEETSLFCKSIAAEIDQVPTEIVLAEYTDKSFLIATQYEKIGGMILVLKDQVSTVLGSSEIFTTKHIFGSIGEEQELAARYLAEQIQISKPIYIFMCLKSYDKEILKAVKDIVLDFKQK